VTASFASLLAAYDTAVARAAEASAAAEAARQALAAAEKAAAHAALCRDQARRAVLRRLRDEGPHSLVSPDGTVRIFHAVVGGHDWTSFEPMSVVEPEPAEAADLAEQDPLPAAP
jgi:hypothetical protein